MCVPHRSLSVLVNVLCTNELSHKPQLLDGRFLQLYQTYSLFCIEKVTKKVQMCIILHLCVYACVRFYNIFLSYENYTFPWSLSNGRKVLHLKVQYPPLCLPISFLLNAVYLCAVSLILTILDFLKQSHQQPMKQVIFWPLLVDTVYSWLTMLRLILQLAHITTLVTSPVWRLC